MPPDLRDPDLLAINTIRTLSMDAVQAGQLRPSRARRWRWPRSPTASGSDFLRFDPADPIWPNRDRFVLSDGPRLDAALLAAAPDRREGGQPEVRDARRAVGPARRHQAVPPARQQVPRPPRVPLDLRRRDHHRPARPGRRHQRRHGDRRHVAGRALQPARLRAVRLQRLRPLRRRLHDGGHLQRGRLARRAPQARQPLLDLRQQPASPSRATPTWPSARTSPRASSAYGWNVTRVGDANDLEMLDAAPSATFKSTHGPADADHRRQPHRLRRAATSRTRTPPTASRSARRRSG